MSTDTKTPYTDISDRISEIFQRKVDKGIDCTDDESAAIKRYFDLVDPESTFAGSAVALAFTTEHAEWDEEVARNEEVRLFAVMRREIEAFSDRELEKELSFAEGFDDRSSPGTIFWLEGLRHESRTRGVFVAEEGYAEIGDWLYDSDYAIAPDVGWVNIDTGHEVVPEEVYADAHQAMTWADALESFIG